MTTLEITAWLEKNELTKEAAVQILQDGIAWFGNIAGSKDTPIEEKVEARVKIAETQNYLDALKGLLP